ncbi:hypothetical protein IWX84_002401 [Flavobacterium sp. CG_9.10]|nr:hypothetical protein [Flavobacterium sp. CG_9.10]
MNFSSFKNIPTMYLYLVSIISFVLANLVRDKNRELYYFLLVFGLIFFVVGMVKRIKNR